MKRTTDRLTGKPFRWNDTVIYMGYRVPARITSRGEVHLAPDRVMPDLLDKLNQLTYEARGDGKYRVFGPGFFADVHMYHAGGRWLCRVDSSNNQAVNAMDIKLWCEENIR